MHQQSPSLVIIADDLTGAGDCGLPFAAGLKTMIVLSDPPPPADILVINTASRGMPADLAAERVAAAARKYQGAWQYKKIDSTLRGHIGVELDAMMEASGKKCAVVAPAFPGQGRRVSGGRVFVDAAPSGIRRAAESDTADPAGSSIAHVLGPAFAGKVLHFDLPMIREATPGLSARMAGLNAGVAICDAENDRDLGLIARAALAHPCRPLFCGSAGLAGALAQEMTQSPISVEPMPPGNTPTLLVAGSRNPVTIRQCHHADRVGMRVIHLSPSRLARGAPCPDAIQHAAASLIAGQDTLLGLDDSEGFISHASAGIAGNLSAAAMQIILSARPGSLVLTGGDMAETWCRQASVAAIHIVHPIMAGVPAGRLIGGVADGLAVATKAGGFGPPDAFTRIAAYFRRDT